MRLAATSTMRPRTVSSNGQLRGAYPACPVPGRGARHQLRRTAAQRRRRRLRQGILHRQPHARRLRARHDHHRHLRLGQQLRGRPGAGVARRLGLGVHGRRAGHGARAALRHHGQETGACGAQARRGHRHRRRARSLWLQRPCQHQRRHRGVVLRRHHGRPVRGRREALRGGHWLFIHGRPRALRRGGHPVHHHRRFPRRGVYRRAVRHHHARGHRRARCRHSDRRRRV